MSEIKISVIIPTYNSQQTLECTLKSIVEQSIGREKVEILVVDGGSGDQTISIAQKYGAIVLKNEKKLPEIAKQIGFLHAKGKYGMFLDSDESMKNRHSFERRIEFLEKHQDIKNFVSTGMICKEGERALIRYTNHVADPFSFFVYRYNGCNRCEDLPKHYQYKKEGHAFLFYFKEHDVLPLFDAAGNMFEMEYAGELYEKAENKENFVATIFDSMVYETRCAAIFDDDFVVHKPGMTARVYFDKLKWRVKNNVFPEKNEAIGFATRRGKSDKLQRRQYLFVPYCLFILPVLFDSIYQAVRNRDIIFLAHIIFAEYTFFWIAIYMAAKILKIPVTENKGYGKK